MARTWPPRYRNADDLPQSLPIFPLAGAVFFPRANLPLNIFEPRYLTMVDDAMRGQRIIAMIQPSTAAGARHGLHRIGCAGRITSYSELDDGRMMIVLHGITRFVLTDELTVTTPYRQAMVSYEPFGDDFEAPEQAAAEQALGRTQYLGVLKRYLKAINVEIDWNWVERAPAEVLVNSFAMLAPISAEEKQALLESADLAERATMALAAMQLAIAGAGGNGERRGPLN